MKYHSFAGKIVPREKWSLQEQALANQYFGDYINSQQFPGFSIIREIKKLGVLQNRSCATIKTWISNKIKRNKCLNADRVDQLTDIKAKPNAEVKKKIKFIFRNRIALNSIPNIGECSDARKQNNMLQRLSPKKIQYIVIKAIQKKTNEKLNLIE